MDNHTRSKIYSLIDKSFNYWESIRAEYGLGDDPIPITFYPLSYINSLQDPYLIEVLCNDTARCLTVVQPMFDKNNIIAAIKSHIYCSYSDLYQLLIECELDYDKAFNCMKLTLRHELGHILDHKSLIGKTSDDWDEFIILHEQYSERIPRLRANASYQKRLEWFLMYNNLPDEKRANDLVGITEKDIIEDYKRCHRK